MGLFNFLKKEKKTDKKRGYNSASKSARLSRWFTGRGDANQQIEGNLDTLRERSRDLNRNNPYVRNALRVLVNNTVGEGITTRIEDNAELDKLFKEWTNSKEFDFERRHNYKSMQRLVYKAVGESGEVLLRRRVDPKRKYPFCYQVLEADFLDDTILNNVKDRPENIIIQGVEFNPDGQIVGYHLYENHPGSIHRPYHSLRSKFVPANEILHIYEQERPGQVRGVPKTAAIGVRAKDLDDYEDAQLMRQKIAACFTAFVRDISADFDDCEDTSDDELASQIEPGLIEHLPPGKTVEMAAPPTVENYSEFVIAQLRAIASGIGVTYEAMASDYSNVNFSSGRMGWIEMGRNVKSDQKRIMVDQFLDPVVDDFRRMLIIMGQMISEFTAQHIPPRRELVDPTKEIPAMIRSVRAGFDTRSDIIESLGRDAKIVTDKWIKDKETIDQNELIFDSDPRYTTQGGTLHNLQDDSREAENEE